MTGSRVFLLTTLAMLAFAANSLLCRAALDTTPIDAASFTSIRLGAGALTLYVLAVFNTRRQTQHGGNWLAAAALFVYAAGFSFAYQSLSTATGALLLFGAVQLSMIGYGLYRGERLATLQWTGLLMALIGLLGLLLPGASAPSAMGSLLMISAGIAWSVYSIRGKNAGNPLSVSAGNFLRSLPFCLLLSLFFLDQIQLDPLGLLYAILSGALASGVGYAIWYSVLPMLKSTYAATIQLSVPVIAAVGGVLLLDESVQLRLVLSSIAILGGIALVILEKPGHN